MSEPGTPDPNTSTGRPRSHEAHPKTPQMDASARAQLQEFAKKHGQPDPFGSSVGEQGATDPRKQGARKEPPPDPKKTLEEKVREAETRAQTAETRAQANEMVLQEALNRAIQAESALRKVDAANSNLNTALGSARDEVRRLRADLEQARAQARAQSSAGSRRESAPPPGAGDSKGYYKALGLEPHVFDGLSDDQAERIVKSIYRAQTMIHHTDIPGANDEKRIRDINNARDTFLDSAKRRGYR